LRIVTAPGSAGGLIGRFAWSFRQMRDSSALETLKSLHDDAARVGFRFGC
jgi:hypothetical protein